MLRITLAQPRRRGRRGVKGHAKANTEDLPDVIRSNARNVSGTIAQSVSGKRERMQFRSRCSRVLQLVCNRSCGGVPEVPWPVFLFQKGVKGSAFANTHVSFPFSFFIFPSFLLVSFDLPTANFSSILRARCSAVSLYGVFFFFNVKNVPLALLVPFFNFFFPVGLRY